jgi:hypothetical protein
MVSEMPRQKPLGLAIYTLKKKERKKENEEPGAGDSCM